MSHKFSFLLILLVLAGCSTGPFLRPSAQKGTLSTVNPSCPGAKEVINFTPKSQPWVQLRVYATPPGRFGSKGTELRVHVLLRYGEGLPPRSLFGDGESSLERRRIVDARNALSYRVEASRPYVLVKIPGEPLHEVRVPLFEAPHDPKADRSSWWSNGIQLSPMTIASFEVTFPDVYVNGEPFETVPIQFNLSEERFAPVLNC